MAATEYFKVAASNIRRAIDVKRTEINQLLAGIEIKKKDLAQFVHNKETQINNLKSELAMIDQGSNTAARNITADVALVAKMQADISKAQQEFNREHEQIQAQIKNLERELVGTEQLARDLESRS